MEKRGLSETAATHSHTKDINQKSDDFFIDLSLLSDETTENYLQTVLSGNNGADIKQRQHKDNIYVYIYKHFQPFRVRGGGDFFNSSSDELSRERQKERESVHRERERASRGLGSAEAVAVLR